jgi:hypothetical protein
MRLIIPTVILLVISNSYMYAQDYYKIKCNVHYTDLLIKDEKAESMIGDTVLFHLSQDSLSYSNVRFSNNFRRNVYSSSNNYLRITNAMYHKAKKYSAKLIHNDTLILTLQHLISKDTFSLWIRDFNSYYTRNNKTILIRKSVYDLFKKKLQILRFEPEIGLTTDAIRDDYSENEFPFYLVKEIDTHEVKKCSIDSLKKGWKVEEIFIYGSADLFSNIDSINYAAECFDNSIYSMWYSSRSVCLLTSNYLGHKQLVNVFSIEREKGLYSGIPTIDIGKKKRDRYGDLLWYKSRFLSFSIDYNCTNNEDNVDNCLHRNYPIEPVIHNDRIIYFKNASLDAFKLYYTTNEIARLSLHTLLGKHQYLFETWFNKHERFPSKPSLFYSIIKKRFKSLQPINYSKGVTKLTYRMIFGSSETNFYFLGNEYLVDL